ncbi:MAG: tetratricopeptide repeat protein [Bryobacteraceae bacterium]
MPFCFLWLAAAVALAQAPDPAYDPLDKAYLALRQRDYDTAIGFFRKAVESAPDRASIRKDLAYAYLKIGEDENARLEFGEAARLDPADFHAALEYAFLSYESRENPFARKAEARRIFDRIRKDGDPSSRDAAGRAFENVDRPLREGIARWIDALTLAPSSFSGHYELASLAEQRDELALAAEHYEKAWRLLPERRRVLVDLGRVLLAAGKLEEANAALLAASRGSEPRAAEAARELLPERYPFLYEFERALELEPGNVELRRELAYLLLGMNRAQEAEREFLKLASESNDLLSAAQLGFLYLDRNERDRALPLLEKVMQGSDAQLAARVKQALESSQTLRRREDLPPSPAQLGPKVMAEKSLKAGYLPDALRYLKMAHENDPNDESVMLKLGWAYNGLRDDAQAIAWFKQARNSTDTAIAAEATQAYRNLRPSLARVRFTAWMFPLYSSRWKDLFSFAQIKSEFKAGSLPFRPYLSARFIGDVRRTSSDAFRQYLSENSVILAAGVATRQWRGAMLWGEAGWAVNYLARRLGAARMVPDYRGGVSFARGFNLGESRAFYETNADGVFVSRFGDDVLLIFQNRIGYTARTGGLETRFYWNGNLTADVRRQYWANFVETGPGIRFRWSGMPRGFYVSADFLRGVHTINRGNPRRPNFFDSRIGLWYAFTY